MFISSRRHALISTLSGMSILASRRSTGQGQAPRRKSQTGKAKTSKERRVEGLPFIHEDAWRATFEGYVIVDCAVRDRNIVYLVLRKSLPQDEASLKFDSEIPTRFVALFLGQNEPGKRWAHQGLADFRRPVCGAGRVPIGQGMAISANGDVYASGSRRTGMESIVEDDQPTSIENVRHVGDRVYAVGLLREVYRRVEIGSWEPLLDGLPTLTKAQMRPERLFDVGFRDIDGFAEDDLYAVGGKGDVWHHDGQRWGPCRFPDRLPLFTICCAGDGQAYISGEGGTLYRGRGDSWERVWKAESTIPYNDVRWFADRLWLCSDYRLDELVGDSVEAASHNDQRVLLRGHMDEGDGLLVIAGQDTVHAFDGRSWRSLVAPY